MRKPHVRNGFKKRAGLRLQHHVGRPIPEQLFVVVHDPDPAIDGQAPGGNGSIEVIEELGRPISAIAANR